MSMEHPFGYDEEYEGVLKTSTPSHQIPPNIAQVSTEGEFELTKEFPWLEFLTPTANSVVRVLFEKERHYRGSWRKRGGPGAMMMLARKWDRIENIVAENGWDIFQALEAGDGDIEDDVRDLLGYLLLVLAEHERRRSTGEVTNG